jgi:hypothetical protein
LGILRMGFEHPLHVRREEMKNNGSSLRHCIGYTPQADNERGPLPW